MTAAAPPRARGERGWLLVGQILLAVAAAFSLPLGARDGGGVSSILPPLRTALPGAEVDVSSRSDRDGPRRVGERRAEVRRAVRRPLRPRRTAPAVVVVAHRRPPGDDVPEPALLEAGQSRAPPLVR